ncbi:MAG TPA: protein-disulfide reductase DsbD [Campylobacterales bacterium]|nr:protein-disulfide reductase DsbD [Campylobacterales bacterium]
MIINKKKLSLVLFLFSTSLLYAEQMTATQGMLSLAFGSFVAGLLLTFTPCVLPMVPILSSIIMGQGKDISTRKSLMLSLAYVLGTAVTYAIMGAIAGATGDQLQSYFQNIWAIGAMSLVFAVMALSMFDVFTIALPSFIQSRLNKSSQDLKGGSIPMVFILGMVTALILGACVSPVLISFLGVAISTGDALLGAVMMFTMALGMGVPLLLLGLGAGKFLPKAGIWMDKIKYLFGALLLAVSLYLFSTLDLISPLILWGVYLIGLSLFVGAFDTAIEKIEKFAKILGIIMFIWGILLLVGAANGNHDIYKPLAKAPSAYIENSSTSQPKVAKKLFTNIYDMQELDILLAQAKEEEKAVIIYFYHDACPVCKRLNETTWKDPAVKALLAEKYLAFSIDMTDRSDENMQAIKKRFSIFGPPGFIFFDSEGDELVDDSFYGYQAPTEMLDILDLIAN